MPPSARPELCTWPDHEPLALDVDTEEDLARAEQWVAGLSGR